MKVIQKLRQTSPLIHNLTNQVVMNFTANGLLAIGAIPIMSKEKIEVKQMAQAANALSINIGTLLTNELEAMIVAGKTANEQGIPVVFDPVGVAATTFRQQAVQAILHEVHCTVIKGNPGEMAHLVNIEIETRGPDSIGADVDTLIDIAKKVAKKYNTIAVITGEIDIICYENEIKTNRTGHRNLTKITGAGCLLGAIIAAGLAVDGDSFDNTYEIITFYGKAAETAMQHPNVNGIGSFQAHFLDALET